MAAVMFPGGFGGSLPGRGSVMTRPDLGVTRKVRVGRSGPGGSFGFSVGEVDDGDTHVISRVSKEVGHLLRTGDVLLSINGLPLDELSHDDVIARIVACAAFVELEVMGRPSKVRRQSQAIAAAAAQVSREADAILPERNQSRRQSVVDIAALKLAEIQSGNMANTWQKKARESRPSEGMRLRKHSHILNVGEQVREANDQAFEKRRERAVKEAILQEQERAADQMADQLEAAAEQARLDLERALAVAEHEHEARMDQLIHMRNEQEKDAVKKARAEEDAKRIFELQCARKEADARQEYAVSVAIESTQNAERQKARLRQTEAVREAETVLRAKMTADKRDAMEFQRSKMQAAAAEAKRISEAKYARVLAQHAEEIKASENLEAQIAEAGQNLKQAELKYRNMESTHQRLLAVTLRNYDEKEPWLPTP